MAWQTWPLPAKHQIPHANILSITRKYISAKDFLMGKYKYLVFKALRC